MKEFIHLALQCTCKVDNESIVESMCSRFGRHSLTHGNALPMKFENEMHVDWNGPKVGKPDTIISQSMNTYFKSQNWHFKTGSTKLFTYKVVDVPL